MSRRPPPTGGARTMGALLRGPGFRWLYGTRLLSQTADGVFQSSLASAVLFSPERSTDAAHVVAALGVVLLPYSLVGPFAGVLLDRWSRQRVLVRVNLLRAALVAALAAVLVAAGPTGPGFYLLALATVSVNRFYLSALSAALPHVVDRGRLVPANSLSTTSGTFAAIVGAGLGVLLRGDGTDAQTARVAVAAAVVYLLASALARGFDVAALGPDGTSRPQTQSARDIARGLVEGGAHVLARPQAARALAGIAGQRFCYGVTTLAILLAYRNHFTDDGALKAGLAGLTQVVVATGLGTVLAAVGTPVITARIGKPACLTGCFALACVVQLAFGLPFTQGSLLIAAVGLGLTSAAAKICVDATLQESVEDEFRGRVFSFYDTGFNVTFVASAALAAALLPADGVSRAAIVAVGVGYGATAIGYGAAALGAQRRVLP